jgi:hypothetical protein
MSCLLCASNYQEEFATEMIIHFSGLKNLDEPKAIRLHELRIFAFYHSRAELAPFANGAPSCGRATLNARFKAGLRLN